MAAIDDITDDLIIFHKSSVDVVSEDVLTCDGLLWQPQRISAIWPA